MRLVSMRWWFLWSLNNLPPTVPAEASTIPRLATPSFNHALSSRQAVSLSGIPHATSTLSIIPLDQLYRLLYLPLRNALRPLSHSKHYLRATPHISQTNCSYGPRNRNNDSTLAPALYVGYKERYVDVRRGDQILYDQAVIHWSAFHENLNNSNSNKIAPKDRCIVLLSHAFGHASNILHFIQAELIAADDGLSLIVDERHKKDALFVVTAV